MNILVVGDFHSEIHEKAFAKAFKSLGHNVVIFAWNNYFKNNNSNFLSPLYYRAQNKFMFGPSLCKINKDLINVVMGQKFDLVFVYRGTHIFAKTLHKIKKSGTTIFGYNNDDPFGENYPKYFWRHFKRSIAFYKHIFCYREKNIRDYNSINFSRVSILRSYYLKERNFPISRPVKSQYLCDILFIGHYENDGRDECLKAIIESGVDFRLFGPEWHRSRLYEFFREKFGDIHSLGFRDYNIAINSAKIVLVFLSKLNNDTYTRRCFEIPATGAFMLSEYSDDLNGLFEGGKAAEYFRDKNELLQKIHYYLKHDAEREKIAQEGLRKVRDDGNEVIDRAKQVLEIYNSYQKI